MKVLETNYFGKEEYWKWMDMGRIAIDAEAHPELMTELRIATSDEEMSLSKVEYSMDFLDSLRLVFEYILY